MGWPHSIGIAGQLPSDQVAKFIGITRELVDQVILKNRELIKMGQVPNTRYTKR
jgi:hypothetical protein